MLSKKQFNCSIKLLTYYHIFFYCLIFAFFILFKIPCLANDKIDTISTALKLVNKNKSQFGIILDPYLTRLPSVKKMPYLNPSFESLLKKPLNLYSFSKSMADDIEKYFNETYIKENNDYLYHLMYRLGVSKVVSGFSDFGFKKSNYDVFNNDNLIKRFELLSKTNLNNTKIKTQKLLLKFHKDLEALPESIQNDIKTMLLRILQASDWIAIAKRKLDTQYKTDFLYKLKNHGELVTSSDNFPKELSEIAEQLDIKSILYSSLLIINSTNNYIKAIENKLKKTKENIYFNTIILNTVIGKITIADSKNHDHKCKQQLLLIDFGGDDKYSGHCGGTASENNPVSILIDFSGNDLYGSKDSFLSFGAGILGIGISIDLMGNDKYFAAHASQGFGLFGTGFLFDYSGNDIYKIESSGQGSSIYGIGMLLENKGADNYYAYNFSQGFSTMGGAGVLVDYKGNDLYIAEPDASITKLGDYHSEKKISINMSQGASSGRRADITDGLNFGGGIGGIFDIKGNDIYKSGNWSKGIGYWFGTGISYDGSGDDKYESVYFSHGSAAHFANGILIDESGNDKHTLKQLFAAPAAGAGLGFGWDFANGILIDLKGDDKYSATVSSMGVAQIRSCALFIDNSGNDVYLMAANEQGMGAATFHKRYTVKKHSNAHIYDNYSYGLFIDNNGTDQYLRTTGHKNANIIDNIRKNNSRWMDPDMNSKNFGFKNFGIGIDMQNGIINFFDD